MQPHCNVVHICISPQTDISIATWAMNYCFSQKLLICHSVGLNDQNKWVDSSKIVAQSLYSCRKILYANKIKCVKCEYLSKGIETRFVRHDLRT